VPEVSLPVAVFSSGFISQFLGCVLLTLVYDGMKNTDAAVTFTLLFAARYHDGVVDKFPREPAEGEAHDNARSFQLTILRISGRGFQVTKVGRTVKSASYSC
jgi:hypothetical protein